MVFVMIDTLMNNITRRHGAGLNGVGVVMIAKRQFLACLVAMALVTLGHSSRANADASLDGARKFIENLAAQATEKLGDEAITAKERQKRFQSLLTGHFDIPTIGRWVLGKHWRKATPAQRRQYMRLFENMVVNTYADRFLELSEDIFKVVRVSAKGKRDIIVRSKLERPKRDSTIQLDWRVRARDGKFKVVDVMAEGVSMGQTQRSEFSSVIRNNGGTIDGLLAELSKRANDGA